MVIVLVIVLVTASVIVLVTASVIALAISVLWSTCGDEMSRLGVRSS